MAAAYKGTSLADISLVACGNDFKDSMPVAVRAGETVFVQLSGTPSNGFGRLTLTVYSDADADGIIDIRDNCPLTPNPLQVDSDGDNIGDACDPTPVHNLEIVGASGSSPLVDGGAGTLNWWAKVSNGMTFPDQVAVYFSLSLPWGCRSLSGRGDTPAPIGALRTATLNFHTTINCDPTVHAGIYSYQVNILVQPYPGYTPQRFKALTGVIEIR